MINKKSQGLSLNVIIVAAIVLIVLIVLWAIFTGKIGSFSQGLEQCRGECSSSCSYPDVVDPQGRCDSVSGTQGSNTLSIFPKECCIKMS